MKKTFALFSLGLVSSTLLSSANAAETNLKFTLDFLIQGPQAPFIVALEKGYYKAQGLNVTIDRGFGSSDAAGKVATGAYDMGFADINAVIEFNAKNPGREVIAVAMIYDIPPFSVLTLKKSGIKTPKDLEGKSLAAPAGDAARRAFPIFAEANGVDASKVKFVTVDAPLREPTLVRGQADGITGFYFTSLLSLKNAGVNPEDVVAFQYGSSVKDLYGNAVVVTPAFAKKNPAAVRGFLKALMLGFSDTLKNPDEAISFLKKRDALINESLEKERLMLAFKNNVFTPDAKRFGLGYVQSARLERSIKLLTKTFDLPRVLPVNLVYSNVYLPPLSQRLFK